jgi:Ca2+-binding RTX toxin-like protein
MAVFEAWYRNSSYSGWSWTNDMVDYRWIGLSDGAYSFMDTGITVVLDRFGNGTVDYAEFLYDSWWDEDVLFQYRDQLFSIESIHGTDRNDTFFGGARANRLFGDVGHDDLYGEGGNDRLHGGAGFDFLVGGLGRDTLTGGADADIFAYGAVGESRRGGGRDTITDFRVWEGDVVDLSSIDANSRIAGNQSFDFIGQFGFSGDAGELRVINGLMQGDINGDGRADFEVRLVGVTFLTTDSLVL